MMPEIFTIHNFLTALLVWGLAIWLILTLKTFKNTALSPAWLISLFTFKIFAGLLLLWIYTFHYSDYSTSDIFKYYENARVIYHQTQNKPELYIKFLTGFYSEDEPDIKQVSQQLKNWDLNNESTFVNDNRAIIRFNLLLLPFSRGNLIIHMVCICFLSFTGLILLFIKWQKYTPINPYFLSGLIFLIPSLAFWTSGVLKEGLCIFWLGILIYSLPDKNQTLKPLHWILIFTGLFMISLTRFYVFICLLPALILLFLNNLTKLKPALNLLISFLFPLLSFVIVNELNSNQLLEKISRKQNDFINLSIGGTYIKSLSPPYDTLVCFDDIGFKIEKDSLLTLQNKTVVYKWLNPGIKDKMMVADTYKTYKMLLHIPKSGSAIPSQRLQANYFSIIKQLPYAFINGFLRPFPGDDLNILGALSLLENLLIVLFIIYSFTIFKKPDSNQIIYLQFLLIFSIILITVTGLMSPVSGAIVRYRVPALPCLLFAVLLLWDNKKTLPLLMKKSH